MSTALAPRDHFAIRDTATGRLFYYVPHELVRHTSYHSDFSLHAEGRPMERLSDSGNWWIATVAAATLSASWTPSPVTTSFRLRDPATESKAFPATLTPQEWDDLRTRYRDAAHDLYQAVTEEQPRQWEDLPGGPWRILEGKAPPVDGDNRWVADLPQALINHPEYRWWLPGKLTGLRSAVLETARKLPQVDSWRTTDPRTGDLVQAKVVVEVPFERPVTTVRTHDAQTGKKLRRPVTEEVKARFPMHLPIPDAVTGETYALALEAWQEAYDHWTDVIAQQAGASACNTCGGHGYVPRSPAKYATPLSPRRDH
ncbi:hypothetical protein ACFC58_06375 [Kitasatospora purpeofusca]|uniref:hypothetical protein n=1 Tax=Kitasatospora purpeofusca TaxID=67352 RepID=UPI0035DE2BE6